MTDAAPCHRASWPIRGCRWEARHDEIAPTKIHIGPFQGRARDYERMIRAGFERIYVRDVCATCGKTIERERRA